MQEHVTWNYGDDYTDINRHIISEFSEWEDIDEDDVYDLQNFLKWENEKFQKQGFYYLLVLDGQEQFTIQTTLDDMREKARKRRLRMQEEEAARLAAAEAAKIKRAETKRARLLKQLAKLNKEGPI